jgi:hypothetical protein
MNRSKQGRYDYQNRYRFTGRFNSGFRSSCRGAALTPNQQRGILSSFCLMATLPLTGVFEAKGDRDFGLAGAQKTALLKAQQTRRTKISILG